ncbi:MAG: hypothetical protein EXQ88_05175 [Alphaproteobacteria bacterium]|nr:hypothetical protein [Alphaproteobacteria bacterium]
MSERLRLDTQGRLTLWALATTAYLALLPLWLPALTAGFDDQGLIIRAAVAIAAIAPAGLLMGFGFPTGMRLINAQDQRPTPWFWGPNGAAGVLASGLAVALSMTFGIGVTLVAGAACYLLLIPAARVIGFPTAED